MTVHRRAKLFETGAYPSKGVAVTRRHLRLWVKNFRKPVPILVEHCGGPLQLGQLIQVERRGEELLGVLALSVEADALVAMIAPGLSLGIAPDLSGIREVSLVQNPAVKDAGFFKGGRPYDL